MSEKNIAQSYKSYIIGFVASAILTLASYFTVIGQIFDRIPIIIAIVTFAIAQLVFQLIYFLHMGDEEKPRWNLYSFIFSLIVIFVLVAGSIWVMYYLNYNMQH
jgi:cytochrome o ubiquinol oxidase operon protein cyoD